jgi:dTDP-4-dehydrorhamnose 3,5-epimerase
MIFAETRLKGAFVIDPEKRSDVRGFFARTFCQKEFEAKGLKTDIAQADLSHNLTKGTLRGMHFQRDPFQEVKMISCLRGAIFDVIIDLRRGSPTYKQWIGAELNEHNHRMRQMASATMTPPSGSSGRKTYPYPSSPTRTGRGLISRDKLKSPH